MTTVSYPGVYIEEIPSGNRPIAMAGTSTPAFVGMTEKGPDDRAVRITGWDEFVTTFGSITHEGFLAEAVFQFFNNGGRQCYVVRFTRSDARGATVTLANRGSTPAESLRFIASSKGEWGNKLLLSIEDGSEDPGNTFKVTIRKQVEANTVPALLDELEVLEVHDNLNMDSNAKNSVVSVLERDSKVLRAVILDGTTTENGKLTGGAEPRLNATDRKFLINLDNDGFHEVTIPGDVDGTIPADIAASITTIVTTTLTPNKSSNNDAFLHFLCEYNISSNQLILTSGTATAASSVRVQSAPANDAAASLKIDPANAFAEDGMYRRRPLVAQRVQLGDAVVTLPAGPVLAIQAGSDGTGAVTESNFSGVFSLLDNVTDISLLAVPGVGTTTMFDAGVTYCENRPLRDLFYLGEMSPTDNSPGLAEQFRKKIIKPNSYGAVYFPWIKSPDLSRMSSTPVDYPPSGFIAGLYARIDSTRGVWKAPAGTEATVSGAIDLACNLTDTQQGNLNKAGINCLRRFDLAGIVSWGARTVTSDPEYLYVPVRRTAIMLKRSIYDGIQWAVFEPNDHRLWAALRMNIGSFMNGLFRAGTFQGEKSSDAYFVRCGLGDTMTQGDIDRGMVIVLVGFAPLKPAEFVIVRIQQKIGQQ